MERKTFHLASESVPSCWWQLYPSADYDERVTPYRVDAYTFGGEFTRTQVGCGSRSVSFGVRFVDSGTAAQVNAWWFTRAPLLLAWNLQTGSASTWRCRLVNQTVPLNKSEDPGQLSLFRGLLQLLPTYLIEPFAGLPFTYDDSSLGLLDQTYNPQLP